MQDLEKRTKVNKIIRKLAEGEDDKFSDSTLDDILKLIDTSDRVVNIDEEVVMSGGEFDE